jgi:hypothetical protein
MGVGSIRGLAGLVVEWAAFRGEECEGAAREARGSEWVNGVCRSIDNIESDERQGCWECILLRCLAALCTM